jgi:5S rRNA maturation endonuclease (ribonuclease M5)
MVARNRRRYPTEIRRPRAEYYAWKKDQAEKVIDSLKKRSDAGIPIIVEGRRDREALGRIGIAGTILCLKGAGESRFHFLEKLDGFKDIILLTDFDREGVELRLWLYQELTKRGIRADDLVWRRMRSLARAGVRSIEELPSFLRSLDSQAMGKRPKPVPSLPRLRPSTSLLE